MYSKNLTNPIYKRLFPATYEKNVKIQAGMNFIQERFNDGPKKEVLDLLYKDTNLESDNLANIR